MIDTSVPVRLSRGFNSLPVTITDTVCLGASDVTLAGGNVRIKRLPPPPAPGACEKQRVQKGATLLGLATVLGQVMTTCSCNAVNALVHRHGCPQTAPVRSFDVLLRHSRGATYSLKSLYTAQHAVWDTGWLEKWPRGKRRLLKASIDYEAVLPSVVSAMVKREVGHARPRKARLIQYYPNLATQAAFGPVFFSLQKTMVAWFQRREIAPGITLTFASGLNMGHLATWMEDVLADVPYGMTPTFYERDGVNWDSTMQLEHLLLRKDVYKCAGVGDDFLDFVHGGFRVAGKHARGLLSYILEGTVKSGHNDTTLGNSVVNGAIAAEAMVALGLRGEILVTGDDLLIVIYGDFDEHALAKVEAECGIKPEYRKFFSPMDVSFISAVWFSAGARWLFCPKPGRLVARLFWTCKPPCPRKAAMWRNGIVLGLAPVCSTLPIVRAFLDAHYTPGLAATEVVDRFQWSGAFLGASARTAPTFEALLPAFCGRYDLTRAQVHACEAFLREQRGKVGLLSHPVLDRLMEVDLADLPSRPLSQF